MPGGLEFPEVNILPPPTIESIHRVVHARDRSNAWSLAKQKTTDFLYIFVRPKKADLFAFV